MPQKGPEEKESPAPNEGAGHSQGERRLLLVRDEDGVPSWEGLGIRRSCVVFPLFFNGRTYKSTACAIAITNKEGAEPMSQIQRHSGIGLVFSWRPVRSVRP
jgi:hypothetical protein